MAKISDTKIPITEFLDAYRRQPCLYNSLLDTYKNRGSREDAYEAIIKSLKIPMLTVLDIKLKIKSVRTVYTKELRILLREKELGRCYVPKLFWFKRADAFLRAVSLAHSKRPKNKDQDAQQKIVEEEQEQEESEPCEPLEDSYANEQQEECNKTQQITVNRSQPLEVIRKPEIVIDDASLCVMEQQPQLPQAQRKLRYLPHPRIPSTPFASPSPSVQLDHSNPTLCVEDDLAIFGQSIACQLRSINDSYARSVAKLRIQQVLFDAETGQFQSSDVVSPQD
ncbi:CG15601 [Drosophila busckii]|uniref:CG15601 n=1 Tax=Drosophila busckii TaxID=30019 RepID=A0A0M4F9H5_DROBS|nr:uncharacterized protein LOC108605106 [Drosophila busckii]ALC49200.1 CG15601 [Drosophila busckii]